jgi:hypothetical protein
MLPVKHPAHIAMSPGGPVLDGLAVNQRLFGQPDFWHARSYHFYLDAREAP